MLEALLSRDDKNNVSEKKKTQSSNYVWRKNGKDFTLKRSEHTFYCDFSKVYT